MPFEILVRPLIPKDTRPPRTQSPFVAPDNEKEFVMNGRSGEVVLLVQTQSWSADRTFQTAEETRLFSTNRIYQAKTDGSGNITSINRNNYVDVETVRGIVTKDSKGRVFPMAYAPQPIPANVEEGVIQIRKA